MYFETETNKNLKYFEVKLVNYDENNFPIDACSVCISAEEKPSMSELKEFMEEYLEDYEREGILEVNEIAENEVDDVILESNQFTIPTYSPASSYEIVRPKFYTVTTLSKYDYTFSVETEKHGAFTNFDAALKRLKEVVEKFKKDYEDEFKEYSNSERYEDENDGALAIYEDYETGYWSCDFGFEERHESHQICIDEWEIEE